MRFIHIADIHLGADPYIGSSRKEKREKEIWTSLERVLEVCESKHVEMLLIAGDLFHRQPLNEVLLFLYPFIIFFFRIIFFQN